MIGNNPLITQNFMADPTAVEYDGRLYVFGTADKMETDSKGNVISNSYNTCELRCISSADLVNWTDHGTIKVNEVATWAKHSWAPTICKREEKNGTMFYLYFANGGDGIGVLRSKSPLGPWEDPSGKRLISRDTQIVPQVKYRGCLILRFLLMMTELVIYILAAERVRIVSIQSRRA